MKAIVFGIILVCLAVAFAMTLPLWAILFGIAASAK